MDEFNLISKIKLQNTLSPKNIARLIEEFIKNKVSEDNYPEKIDEQKGFYFL